MIGSVEAEQRVSRSLLTRGIHDLAPSEERLAVQASGRIVAVEQPRVVFQSNTVTFLLDYVVGVVVFDELAAYLVERPHSSIDDVSIVLFRR